MQIGILLVVALITTGFFLLKPDMKSAAEVKYDGKKINLFTSREGLEKKIGLGYPDGYLKAPRLYGKNIISYTGLLCNE